MSPLQRSGTGERGPLDLILKAALVVTKVAATVFSIEPVIDPHDPKYTGKAMRIRAVGYFGTLLAVPLVWVARGRRRPYPVLADFGLTVPLLLDAGGNAFGIYDSESIDDLVHFANTAILSTGFGALVSPRVDERWKAAGATFAFGLGGELAWEGMEYAAQAVGFRGLGLSREDTLGDIAKAAVGAAIASAITWARWKPPPWRSAKLTT